MLERDEADRAAVIGQRRRWIRDQGAQCEDGGGLLEHVIGCTRDLAIRCDEAALSTAEVWGRGLRRPSVPAVTVAES